MTIMFPDINTDTSNEHFYMEAKLADLATGIWQPTVLELEQLIDHIITCKYCQSALEGFIAASIDDDETENCSRGTTPSLLSRIVQIIREADIQNDLSAYVEVLEIQGEEEASRQFPIVTEHLKRCKACQSFLEETQVLLHRAEDAGLIAPLA